MTIDHASPTWRALEQYVARRIAELHRDLESPKLDEAATQYLRGQIFALREAVNLPSLGKEHAQAPEDPYEGASL